MISQPMLNTRPEAQAYEHTHSKLEQVIIDRLKIIAPSWPLRSQVAVNPMRGFENQPFEKGLRKGLELFSQDWPKPIDGINRQTIKWASAFYDQGQSSLSMPYQELGFYQAFRRLAPLDKTLSNTKHANSVLQDLPEAPHECIINLLEALHIQPKQWGPWFDLLFASLPGWASHVHYLCDWASLNQSDSSHAIDYMAVRLCITYALWPTAFELLNHKKTSYQHTGQLLNTIRQYEEQYANQLMAQLSLTSSEKPSYEAQCVFCIDVRSEPMRRALELGGSVQTYGFAGFFGADLMVENEHTCQSTPVCPVLVPASQSVTFKGLEAIKRPFARLGRQVFHSLKYTFGAPLALAEASGLTLGTWLGLKTIAPNQAHHFKTRTSETNAHIEAIDIHHLSVETRLNYAKSMLKAIGLVDDFAPVLFICGHGSACENNPMKSLLDCGACGGQPGSANAKLMAQIINQPEIRQALAEDGICIPDTTIAMAGLHNTTTDEFEILTDDATLKPFAASTQAFMSTLKQASKTAQQTRLKRFSLSMGPSPCPKTMSRDWACTRPEWGLADNACMIVGPRQLSQELNLLGRSFLHSYDPSVDKDGQILRQIMTAPVIVAQWINAQYLCSTLFPDLFTSGDKITMNIVGKMGVQQGNGSDLLPGPSHQSLFDEKGKAMHTPQRLSVFVYASREKLARIIQSEPSIRQLVENHWLHVYALSPNETRWHQLNDKLQWQGARY